MLPAHVRADVDATFFVVCMRAGKHQFATKRRWRNLGSSTICRNRASHKITKTLLTATQCQKAAETQVANARLFRVPSGVLQRTRGCPAFGSRDTLRGVMWAALSKSMKLTVTTVTVWVRRTYVGL